MAVTNGGQNESRNHNQKFNGGVMKTKYKYIHFVEAEGENKTVSGMPAYECKNNRDKSTLAIIFFYASWKEYCFTQASSNVVFNDGCLTDTIDFIKQLNKEAGLK